MTAFQQLGANKDYAVLTVKAETSNNNEQETFYVRQRESWPDMLLLFNLILEQYSIRLDFEWSGVDHRLHYNRKVHTVVPAAR